MPARRPIRLVIGNSCGRNLLQGGQSGGWLSDLCERYGSPDKRSNRRGDTDQPLVEQRDLRPINESGGGPTSVDGLNGRFELIPSDAFEGRCHAQVLLSFIYHWPRPE